MMQSPPFVSPMADDKARDLVVGQLSSSPPSAAYMRQWIGYNGLSPFRRLAII